jgi:hypothetical protein
MTQTNGLDVLVAWLIFAVFVGVLAVLVLRAGSDDPVREAYRETGDARRDHARDAVEDLPAETSGGRVDPATKGLAATRYPDPDPPAGAD